MHYLLVHSPLVTPVTWSRFAPLLERTGSSVDCLPLAAAPGIDHSFHTGYMEQIADRLGNSGCDDPASDLVVVAHSGAGSLLTGLDPLKFHAAVFLDAIFSLAPASRFDLFDNPATVQAWQRQAAAHAGMLPANFLSTFNFDINDPDMARQLASSIQDLPLAVYEESITPHPGWRVHSNGLYIHWTKPYAADLARARAAGLHAISWQGSHFEMLNDPTAVVAAIESYLKGYPV